MQGEVINVNYSGDIHRKLDLTKLHFENGILHQRPLQLTIKDSQSGGCVIFFNSGKFRLMGLRSDDDLDAFALAYKYTSQIDKDLMPTIKLKSMCSKANYGAKLKLYKLSSQFSETA